MLFLWVPSKTISYWTDYASKIQCKDVLEIEKYMIHFVAFLWIFFKGGGSFSISTSYTMYVFLFCCVRSQCSDVELVLQLVCSLEYFKLIIWSCDLMGHFIMFMESLKVVLQFKVIYVYLACMLKLGMWGDWVIHVYGITDPLPCPVQFLLCT